MKKYNINVSDDRETLLNIIIHRQTGRKLKAHISLFKVVCVLLAMFLLIKAGIAETYIYFIAMVTEFYFYIIVAGYIHININRC